MIAFGLAVAALLAIAVAWVVIALVRRQDEGGVDAAAANAAILREQSADLQREHALGALTAAQYAGARRELERRALDEVGVAAPRAAVPSAPAGRLGIAIACLLPIAALLLYFAAGTPGAVRTPGAPYGGAHATGGLEALVDALAARLGRQPGDADEWAMLARSQAALGRYREAVESYRRAVASGPDRADWLVDYADALAMTQGGRLEGAPLVILQRALAADPDHAGARALAGAEAYGRGDYLAALSHWERALARIPPESALSRSMTAGVERARPLAAAGGRRAEAGARVTGKVSLAPGLEAAAEDSVFVYARPPGPARMPIAAVRVRVRDLPYEFVLDDRTAMVPGTRLAGFEELVVGARIAKSGGVTPAAGDLEAPPQSVRVGGAGVALTINRVLP
jgi:cytochrome c-type biogenesis protein CcmH